jgi:hypothetical protein
VLDKHIQLFGEWYVIKNYNRYGFIKSNDVG